MDFRLKYAYDMLIIMLHAWHLEVIQRRGSFSNKSNKTFWSKTTISTSVLFTYKWKKNYIKKNKKKTTTQKHFPGGDEK